MRLHVMDRFDKRVFSRTPTMCERGKHLRRLGGVIEEMFAAAGHSTPPVKGQDAGHDADPDWLRQFIEKRASHGQVGEDHKPLSVFSM